jgi:hypothetical protein
MPIFNVVVIRILSCPSRVLRIMGSTGNMLWFGLACWIIMERYPSHPAEEGLIEYVVLMALTPLLSAVAIYLHRGASEPALPT